MNELHLFAGAGGGILAGQMLGHRCVCAVEWEPYAAAVLVQRQNDGLLPPFPIWDDVRTFDGRPWRGVVDVVAGGFPCQDISVAGKGAGITGERSGMWSHMARIVGEARPSFVFVENTPALLTRGLGVVLSDLAALGYDARWTVLGASDVGAPHQRDRLWIVARSVAYTTLSNDATSSRSGGCGQGTPEQFRGSCGSACHLADADSVRELQPQGCQCNQQGRSCDCGLSDARSADVEGQRPEPVRTGTQQPDIGDAGWWITEPDVGRVAHGVAARVDRLKAIGNGQVPLCAATAFRMLVKGF